MFNNLTIKMKIVSITLGGLFSLSIILGTLAILDSKKVLMKKNYDVLSSVNKSKKQQVEGFFSKTVVLLYFVKL